MTATAPDSDLDGYSNPDDNWTVDNGADALPSNPTQWLDGDGDGYGGAADGKALIPAKNSAPPPRP